MEFAKIKPGEIDGNVFRQIGDGWMLVTAGTMGGCNTMTASWGGLGVLWSRPVGVTYVRPTRYTKEFLDREAFFSLSFFVPGEHREALNLLGTKSGRDGDKIAESGLTLREFGNTPAFGEAGLVLLCRKLYVQEFSPRCFSVGEIAKANYPLEDYHVMYVGGIEEAYVRQG